MALSVVDKLRISLSVCQFGTAREKNKQRLSEKDQNFAILFFFFTFQDRKIALELDLVKKVSSESGSMFKR